MFPKVSIVLTKVSVMGNIENLRKYIDERRDELGLSRNQVAKKARKTSGWISKLMSGDRKDLKLETFADLSKALDVKVSKLVAIYEGEDLGGAFDDPTLSPEALMKFLKEIPKEILKEAYNSEKADRGLD